MAEKAREVWERFFPHDFTFAIRWYECRANVHVFSEQWEMAIELVDEAIKIATEHYGLEGDQTRRLREYKEHIVKVVEEVKQTSGFGRGGKSNIAPKRHRRPEKKTFKRENVVLLAVSLISMAVFVGSAVTVWTLLRSKRQ